MPAELFFTLGALHLVMLASPGPDFALMLRTCHNRTLALGAALGIALAILLHSLLSLTGISLLVASAPWLFNAIKLAGALARTMPSNPTSAISRSCPRLAAAKKRLK